MDNFISSSAYDEAMAKALHQLVDSAPINSRTKHSFHELIEFCSNAKRVHTIINIV